MPQHKLSCSMCERPGRHVSPVGALIATSSQLLTIVVVLSSLWSFATSAPHNDSQTLVCLKLHLSSSALDSWNQNDSCSWPGVTCSAASRVVALDLDSSGLDGQIPPCIGNLTLVTRIHFANNRLAGVIPPELGQLRRLRYLNLSSNNITDDGMGARLSDFGLAKFIHSSLNSTTSTSLGPRGSIGYIAPEYGYGSKISTEGDVYSYGILILAMLTGKQPTDESFSNGLSLHRYVENVFPQRISEILDPNITQSIGDVGVDNNLEHEKDAKAGLLSRIIQLIKLGLSCSMEAPKDRPTMLEVCAEVTAIKQAISAMCIQE